jgi:hypothetical protein
MKSYQMNLKDKSMTVIEGDLTMKINTKKQTRMKRIHKILIMEQTGNGIERGIELSSMDMSGTFSPLVSYCFGVLSLSLAKTNTNNGIFNS